MRINPLLVPVLVISLLLGSVLTSQLLGAWSTSGRATVDLERLAPADVKGWMTLQQVIDGVPIPQAELYQRAGIPPELPTSTALKEIEAIVAGFETTAVRDALAAWQQGAGASTPPAPTPTPPAAPAGVDAPALAPSADPVKGSQTLAQVAAQTGVPLADLLAALGLPPSVDVNVVLKDLIAQGSLGDVTVVRDAVAALQNR